MITDTQHELVLHGVRPEPLASYLKGLGIIRLVAQQKEPDFRAFWRDDELVLVTGLDMEELMDFFLTEYRPTPIVSPWHGSCGFYPESPTVRHLGESHDPRLAPYRTVILLVEKYLEDRGIVENPVNMKDKELIRNIIRDLRNLLPDESITWLDAAVVVLDRGLAEPGVLASGGSDAHLEFAHNFMQRIDSLLLGGESDFSKNALISAFLGGESGSGPVLAKAASGQFDPGRAGGSNMTAGFAGDSLVNPWDYVLLIEGVTMLASQPARRLYSSATYAAAAPFSTSSSPAGYGSAALRERRRAGSLGEFWAPLWTKALSVQELQMVFSEGRSNVAHSHASTGTEFSIAVSNLGTDGAVGEFVRFGFLQRFGEKNHLATPLGRFLVHPGQDAMVLEELVGWLGQLGRVVVEDSPALTLAANRLLENSVMEYAQRPSPACAQRLLCSLASLHRTIARSRLPAWFRPIRPLGAEWLPACDDGSAEYALAFSVAAWVATCRRCFLRELVLPVGRDKPGRFVWDPEGRHDVVNIDDPLHALELLLRSIMDAKATDSARVSGWAASWADVAAFIDGSIDAGRVLELITALSLVDASAFWSARVTHRHSLVRTHLPAVYCHLKPFFAPEAQFARPDGTMAPLQATAPMLAALERHRVTEAANAARMALVARGMVPVGSVRGGRTELYHGPRWPVSTILQQRLYAGLLFPVDNVDHVLAQCLRPISKEASI